MPGRPMDTKEILIVAAVGGKYPERRVLSVSDEHHARLCDVVVVHGIDRKAAQTHDLTAIRRAQILAHWSDATARSASE